MREITLTNTTEFALVDEQDYERVVLYKWRLYLHKFVGMTTDPNMTLHRFIMGMPADGFEWDHKDRNPLNNQRTNLRQATHSQNLANRGKQKGVFSSQYKGVSWYTRKKMWRAQIKVRGKLIFLGYFDDEQEAARTYDEAASKYFGEFAVPNFTVVG